MRTGGVGPSTLRLPLLALACVVALGAACQRPPRSAASSHASRDPAAPQSKLRSPWSSWTERAPEDAVTADLERRAAIAHAVTTVVDELDEAERARVLSPLWPYGPDAPLSGPWPEEASPRFEPWRADELELQDVLATYEAVLGTPELAVAALFVGTDALARARKGLRRVPPEKVTYARLRPRLRNRTERAALARAEEALTRSMLFGLMWPVERTYRISSGFGPRWHPVRGRFAEHRGIDIATPEGTPIHSPLPGKVRRATQNRVSGKWIEIDHGRGVISQYLHLSEIQVKRGQKVEAGEPIALSGATGRVTGPHLHYQVKRNSAHVDPVSFRVAPERAARPMPRTPPSAPEGSQTAMP